MLYPEVVVLPEGVIQVEVVELAVFDEDDVGTLEVVDQLDALPVFEEEVVQLDEDPPIHAPQC